MFLQPIFPRYRLQVTDEVNESHDHNGENICGGERGNKKRESCEQTRLQVNNDDPGKDIEVECRSTHGAHSFIHLFARGRGHLAHYHVQKRLLADVEHKKKHSAHHHCANRQQQKHTGNFPKQIFEPRDRFRENRVNCAVLDVLRNQSCGGDNCQQRREN